MQAPVASITDLLDSSIAMPAKQSSYPTSIGRFTNVVLAYEKAKQRGHDPNTDPIIVDYNSSSLNWAGGYSPCITAARGSQGGHWVSHLRRHLTWEEMVKLMGVRPTRVQAWEGSLTNTECGRVIGNAVHVGVLRRLLAAVLRSAGLRD